jgi:hypothetical protein
MSKQQIQMLKSWAKVFGSAVVALLMSGQHDPRALFAAGSAALLPVVYTWLDPSDARFGKVPPKPAKKTVRKKVK